jgi:hypothetical protein
MTHNFRIERKTFTISPIDEDFFFFKKKFPQIVEEIIDVSAKKVRKVF